MKKWYSCNEHIDIVIDEMVDQFEHAPALEVINHPADCHWCGKRAIYQLKCAQESEESSPQ